MINFNNWDKYISLFDNNSKIYWSVNKSNNINYYYNIYENFIISLNTVIDLSEKNKKELYHYMIENFTPINNKFINNKFIINHQSNFLITFNYKNWRKFKFEPIINFFYWCTKINKNENYNFFHLNDWLLK
jgi:hypothetical protein